MTRRYIKQISIDDYLYKQLSYCACKNGCWEWPFATARGYAYVRYAGENAVLSRLVFTWFYKERLVSTDFVCHSCDNPKCVNPLHLFKGTAASNAQDKLCKGRPNGGGPPRPSKETVTAVKDWLQQQVSWKEIVSRTRLSTSTIAKIRKGIYD